MDMKCKKALICGGTSGIGYACSSSLLNEGADINISGRNASRLIKASKQLAKNKTMRVRTTVADMLTQEGHEKLIHELCDIDILVLILPRAPELSLSEINLEQMKDTVACHLAFPTMLAIVAAEKMAKRHFGRIITILGTSAKSPLSSHLLSNASRTGYLAAMSSLSRNVASNNVTVNNILIGHVETAGLREVWERRAENEKSNYSKLRDTAINRIPMGRLGSPEEAGALCAFLASDGAGYITSQSIVMDGGAYPGLF